jgi:hypothetical protein
MGNTVTAQARPTISAIAKPATARATGRRDFGLCPALIFACLAFLAVMGLEVFAINPERPAAILFPAGISEEQAYLDIVAAGGLPVRPAHSVLHDGVVWIAAAGDPDFFRDIWRGGALAVINPVAFGGCLLELPS